MTAKNYADMTDAELNEAAAIAIGWERLESDGPGRWLDSDERYRITLTEGNVVRHMPHLLFWPASDHNHAAEFMAYVSARCPDGIWAMEQSIRTPRKWSVSFSRMGAGADYVYVATNAALSRAETIAGLRALDAMQKGAG